MYKESETIEFKKSTAEFKEAVVAIVAMLNKHGQGEVYFGISDDGKVVGQDIGRMTIKEVTQVVVDNIEPKIYPKVETRKIKGKDCVVIEAHGINSPYFAYGRAYIRVGESNKHLSVQEIENLIVKKKKLFWENEISEKELKDVNTAAVKEYMRKANTAKRINFKYTNVKQTLKKLGLLHREKLTKAAEILFCDDSSMEIQAAVFAGIDKITFLDIRKFKGNIFNLREQAEAYVKEHVKWRAEIKTGPRKEIPEIPVEAIREAVGNSLCHRDYANPKGNEVAIFKDRVDIYNPGTFPDELNPQDFVKGGGYSILRNPLIAETMYKSEDIEKWASGLKRIYDECTAVGIKVEFKRVKTGFVVSFYRPRWEEGEGLEVGGQKTVEKTVERTVERILVLIKDNPQITQKKLMVKTGLTRRGVEWNLKKLKEANRIRRIGPDKGGHWEI
jgi:ATP-dependent DNA helicase RecG